MWNTFIVAIEVPGTKKFAAMYGSDGTIMLHTPQAAKEIVDNIIQKSGGKTAAKALSLLEVVSTGIEYMTEMV